METTPHDVDVECGHHWHVTRNGWSCCCCPATVGHHHDRPVQHAECASPDHQDDGITSWLAPARSITVVPRRFGDRARRLRRHPATS